MVKKSKALQTSQAHSHFVRQVAERFLESVPEVSAKLKKANTKERKFEDVVKSAEQAAVLVLV
jgi:hypothetical protein